jgi:hypothetical protein
MPVIEGLQTTLTPVEWHALKVVGANAAACRDALKPSKQNPVDLLVRIRGNLSVGEDGVVARKQKPTVDEVLAFVLANHEEMKTLGPGGLGTFILNAAKANGGTIPEVEEAFHVQAKQIIGHLTKTVGQSPRKGSVKGNFQVGTIEPGSMSKQFSSQIDKAVRAISFEEEDDDEG